MSIFSHPKLKNEFQTELNLAGSQNSEVSAKANPVFTWIAKHKAGPLLFKALAQHTNFKPTPGLERKPSHFTSPPPGGRDYCIGIVMTLDDKGKLWACATNAMTTPVKTENCCPTKFPEAYSALRSTAAQIKLIHDAISCAASKEHLDWVERAFEAGQHYRTSPIFLVVLDGDKQFFYATTALVQGPQQIDRSLECTGKVSA